MSNERLKTLERKISKIKFDCPSVNHIAPFNSMICPSCFGPDECFHGCEIFIPMDVQVHVLSNKSIGNIAWRMIKKLETFRSEHIDKMISELKFIAEKPDEHNKEV